MITVKKLLIAICTIAILTFICLTLIIKLLIGTPDEPKQTLERQQNYTIEQFIDTISSTAQSVAADYDLYASVMIAQAVLESDNGNSSLGAEPNNNLYGIKGSYKGDYVTYETNEDDGNGNMKTVVAKFRKYPSFEHSMVDYAKLLANGTSWNTSIYHKTHKSKSNSYKDATKALTGVYATDTRYNIKLNALIQQYDLTKYDK